MTTTTTPAIDLRAAFELRDRLAPVRADLLARLDADDPEALVLVNEFLAEANRVTDDLMQQAVTLAGKIDSHLEDGMSSLCRAVVGLDEIELARDDSNDRVRERMIEAAIEVFENTVGNAALIETQMLRAAFRVAHSSEPDSVTEKWFTNHERGTLSLVARAMGVPTAY
jgi:hypothetical protein